MAAPSTPARPRGRSRQRFARRRAGGDRDADRRRLPRQRQKNLRHRSAGVALVGDARGPAAMRDGAARGSRGRARQGGLVKSYHYGKLVRRAEFAKLWQFRRRLCRRVRRRRVRRRAAAAVGAARPPEGKGAPGLGPWSLTISAVYLGVGEASLEAAARYANSRRPTALGRPIAEAPAIQERIGVMAVKLEAARTA